MVVTPENDCISVTMQRINSEASKTVTSETLFTPETQEIAIQNSSKKELLQKILQLTIISNFLEQNFLKITQLIFKKSLDKKCCIKHTLTLRKVFKTFSFPVLLQTYLTQRKLK